MLNDTEAEMGKRSSEAMPDRWAPLINRSLSSVSEAEGEESREMEGKGADIKTRV